jgi:WD40 repeat protein
LHLWVVPVGAAELATLAGHERALYSLAYSSDGKLLASGDSDGNVIIWDVQTRKAIHNLDVSRPRGPVSFLAFGSNDKTLLTNCMGLDKDGPTGEVRLWDVRTGEEQRAFRRPGIPGTMAASPGCKFVASGIRRPGELERITERFAVVDEAALLRRIHQTKQGCFVYE